jgi:hypothetical protein
MLTGFVFCMPVPCSLFLVLISSPYPLIIESVGFTVSILAVSLGVVILLSGVLAGADGLPQAAMRAINVASMKHDFFIIEYL